MKLRLSAVEAFMLALFCFYAFLFYQSISPYIFSEIYTTDDARQQLYPLWRAVYHDAFRDDPITESMMGYLSPLHWEISYLVTLITKSPVMTGHVVMTVQLGLAVTFLYLLVKFFSDKIPALFSVIWFLHSRNLPQRLTGGLPRGWAPFVLLSALYFMAKQSQYGVLIVLLAGILLNPPAAFIMAVCYGAFLFFRTINSTTRTDYKPLFFKFLISCPFFAAIAIYSLRRPAKFGHIATLEEAEENPAFSAAGGRFPFVPLKSPITELKVTGTQAFQNKWHELPSFLSQQTLLFILLGVLLSVYLIGLKKKRQLIPLELTIYFFSILLVYFLSRFFAFQLYVPDRHLQYPLNIFWISSFSILIWRLARTENEKIWQIRATFYFIVFAGILSLLGGTGLEGDANFNTKTDRFQRLHAWVRLNTSRSDVFAGHPKELDLLPLASVRMAYITEETAHPFYSGYWNLVKSRMETSFRMLYASNPKEFLESMGEEKIDYFVFNRSRFQPAAIKSATSFLPLDRLVKKLVAKNQNNFFYELLDLGAYSQSIVYQDNEVLVIKPALLQQ